MSRLRNYKRLCRILKLRDEMKDTIEKASNTKKKPSRRKYIIAVGIILCILAGYIYLVVTWTPVDSESQKASDTKVSTAPLLPFSVYRYHLLIGGVPSFFCTYFFLVFCCILKIKHVKCYRL